MSDYDLPPAPPPAPPPASPKKHRTLNKVILWAVGALLIVGVIASLVENKEKSSPSVGGDGTEHNVTYRVDGPVRGSITYQNENGDPSQETDASLPWSTTVRVSEGSFLYVSAQNSAEFGDMTCTIEVDGSVAETNASSGAFSICTASATL
jgi:hypothetical protein